MRIAITTGHLSELAGGLSASVPGLAKSLDIRCGIECHILGVLDRARPQAWREWGEHVHPLDEFGPRAFGFAPRYKSQLAAVAPDLLDTQGLWMYPSKASHDFIRGTQIPYVMTPRGMLDPWAIRRSRWKKRLVSWWFESKHLRTAACLRATAELEAGHFRAYGLKNAIAVVPNGIDLPVLPPAATSRGDGGACFF